MKRMTVKLIASLFFGALLALARPAYADGDHDRARRAFAAGEVVGLEQLLAVVARDQPGRIIGVELDRYGGRYIYKVKLITPEGSRRSLRYDAQSLEPYKR